MFILEDYINFVRTQVKNKVIYYGKDTTDIYLEALYQFNTEPTNYLKNIHTTTLSKKYKLIFGKLEKPVSVSYNYWFLFKFGYKRCSKCCNILELDSFNKDKNNWSTLYTFCKECHCDKAMDYATNNLDKIALSQSIYRQNNLEKLKEYNTKYRLAHLAEDAARSMKRYSRKLKAAPLWLTKKQLDEIAFFYKEAKRLEKETGIKHHVDHIVPLQGTEVCGLHVPWNLQVLTATDNISKSNKLLY